MHKTFLIYGAFFGGLAVILGAFGAHGLQKIVTDDDLQRGFKTATQYQMYHALALLAVGILYEKFPGKLLQWAGNFFIIGIILFSGSLYCLTAINNPGSSLTKVIGPVTPLGGAFLIIGWLLLFIGLMKKS